MPTTNFQSFVNEFGDELATWMPTARGTVSSLQIKQAAKFVDKKCGIALKL